MDEHEMALHRLKRGATYPYDAPGPAADWAHAAARGVLADLCDRRGVKHELNDVDYDVRVEMVATLAGIIRATLAAAWVPCSERMPGDDDRVLILVGEFITIGRRDNGEWHDQEWRYLPDEEVSHWMPLPPPPREG